MLAEEMKDKKSTLAQLAEPVTLFPQYLINLRVKDKNAVMEDPAVLEEVDKVEAIINGNGRVLLRQSGTEPVIRVMVEAETDELCKAHAHRIYDFIKERGHAND